MTAAPLDLNAMEAAERKASPAPWKSHYDGAIYRAATRGDRLVFADGDRCDAAFLVALRNAAPALFAAARERDAIKEWQRATIEHTMRLREALEAAVEALGHIPDMRGCLHEAWFSSVEDAPSASSAENEVKSIESIARYALAKARAALGLNTAVEAPP